MNFSRRLSPLAALACAVVLGGVFAPGCGRQQEGARCSLLNGNLDCDGAAMVCTPASQLRLGDGVDRCCPKDESDIADNRCAPRIGSGSGGGGNEGGATSDDGQGGDAPVSGEGDRCQYNSDCKLPFICGPGGRCQYECQRTRDCANGWVCEDRSCVQSNGGTDN